MSRTFKDRPLTETLLDLKNVIQNARDAKARAEGTRDELLRRFKDEYGCRTIEQVKDKLKDLEKSIAEDEQKLEDGAGELQDILLENSR